MSEPGINGYPLWRIKAAEGDLSWDVPNGDLSPGNWIQLYPWHSGDNQLWREEAKLIDTVVIKSQHNQRVLDVPGFAPWWSPIQHFAENGGFNQAWEIEGDPGNPQKIRSVSSGRYLASTNVYSENFSVIFQAEGADSDFQRWTLDLDSSGTGKIQNVETGVFLSVATGPGTHGAELRGLPADGSTQQQWQIKS